MAKWSELKSYKVAISGGAAGVWEVRDEFVCEERTQIIGYFGSIINTGGTHGAMAISKSGHVNPGVELQTNVLAYWESQAGEFMQETFFYPTDCRPEFVGAFKEMLRLALDDPEFQIVAPFIYMKKSEIVKVGSELGVPFRLTRSCYSNEDLHCGGCRACLERKRAFIEAGIKDPTKYRR